ncbi:MAG TPA: hypothetical protein VIC82_05135 [Candidatus Nanopelagicales bacterium]
MGWSVAAFFVLFAVTELWPHSAELGLILLVVPLGVLACFGVLWTTWMVGGDRPAWLRRLARNGLWVLALVVVALQAWITWRSDPSYGTDAVAFNERAARLLLAGQNPYGQDLSQALEDFQVPPIFHTLRLDGGSVDLLSYPAGSFLPIALAVLAGVGVQAGNLVNLVFWSASCLLVGRLLPQPFRWVGIVLLLNQFYLGYVLGGVTDVVYLPFLVLGLWRWDRFRMPGVAGVERWIGPIAMGLACTVKQTPWFFLPFLLVGLWYEARARGLPAGRIVTSYAGRVAVTFLVLNLPFLLWGPADWVRGALLPLVEPTVPDGVGFVSWMVIGGVGGGDLTLLAVASALILIVVLLAYTAAYDRWKRFWPLVVPIFFVVPARSLASYLIMTLPAALVAVATVGPAPAGWSRSRYWPKRTSRLLVILGGAAAAVVVVAFAVRPPFELSVESVRTTGARQSVSEVVATVTNRSAAAAVAHFTVNINGRYTLFWEATGEDGTPVASLQPGETRRVILHAPNSAAMPGVESTFFVNAFSDSPKSVARSDSWTVSRLRSSLSPSSVPEAVPVDRPVTLRVQLRDRYGAVVERSGVGVQLGQIVYAQDGLLAGVASINGEPQGRSPVKVLTDANGVATFQVVGRDVLNDPVYFQAWIDDGEAPYGYSNITSIRFRTR